MWDLAINYIKTHPQLLTALFAASTIFLLFVLRHYRNMIKEERVSFGRRIKDLEARLVSEKDMYRSAIEVQRETNKSIIEKLRSELDKKNELLARASTDAAQDAYARFTKDQMEKEKQHIFSLALTAVTSTSATTATIFEKPLTVLNDNLLHTPPESDSLFGGVIKDHELRLNKIRASENEPLHGPGLRDRNDSEK